MRGTGSGDSPQALAANVRFFSFVVNAQEAHGSIMVKAKRPNRSLGWVIDVLHSGGIHGEREAKAGHPTHTFGRGCRYRHTWRESESDLLHHQLEHAIGSRLPACSALFQAW